MVVINRSCDESRCPAEEPYQIWLFGRADRVGISPGLGRGQCVRPSITIRSPDSDRPAFLLRAWNDAGPFINSMPWPPDASEHAFDAAGQMRVAVDEFLEVQKRLAAAGLYKMSGPQPAGSPATRRPRRHPSRGTAVFRFCRGATTATW